jgi:signal transduction histidine kinase/CheY-like chemotaxis protein
LKYPHNAQNFDKLLESLGVFNKKALRNVQSVRRFIDDSKRKTDESGGNFRLIEQQLTSLQKISQLEKSIIFIRNNIILALLGIILLGSLSSFGLFILIKKSHEITQQKLKAEFATTEAKLALKAKEAAEIANKAKSTFLASMSHELRTPLNAILGFAQIMQRSPTLPQEHQENLNIITRSGNHLLSLINDVLDMSKIEAGKITLDEHNFDLHHLLNEVRDLFYLKAESKHLQLQVERGESVSRYIRTDGTKLRQVLINLIGNALKFTQEGGVFVFVDEIPAHSRPLHNTPLAPSKGNGQSLGSKSALGRGFKAVSSTEESPHDKSSARRELRDVLSSKESKAETVTKKTTLRFSVKDTGAGIAEDELEKLFEAFGQTAAGRSSQEGTGLGLPISCKFVQLMGGDIIVQSEVGNGTVFEFTICAKIVSSAETVNQHSARQVIALEPNQPRYRILIVDDKRDNRRLLIQLLNPFGFELREASNGQEAIDIFENWQPDLIWMDIHMPVMDGLQATQHLKVLPNGQNVAIIALTASVVKEEQEKILAVGCDDFLRKPFKEAEIFDLMHKHIGVRYIYEQVKGTEPQQSAQDISIPDALAALPDELLAQMRQAAITLEIESMPSLIEQVRPYNKPLANALLELANNLQYDRLQALIEQAQT